MEIFTKPTKTYRPQQILNDKEINSLKFFNKKNRSRVFTETLNLNQNRIKSIAF